MIGLTHASYDIHFASRSVSTIFLIEFVTVSKVWYVCFTFYFNHVSAVEILVIFNIYWTLITLFWKYHNKWPWTKMAIPCKSDLYKCWLMPFVWIGVGQHLTSNEHTLWILNKQQYSVTLIILLTSGDFSRRIRYFQSNNSFERCIF